MCDVNDIKKARYTLQVTATCLMRLLQEAYKIALTEDDHESFENWVMVSCDQTMFKYWYNVLQSIKTVFLFIRSFREANFPLFISTIEQLIPLFFALDRVNYSRWSSVFIQDLKELQKMHQPLFEHFVAGYFAVNSVGLQFSKIAYDQKHEHNNKEVKSSSGYINLANKEDLDF